MKLLQPRRFHPGKAAWILLVLAAYFLYTTNRDRAPRVWSWTGEIFGSTYSVQFSATRFNERATGALRLDVEQRLQQLDRCSSTWKPDSDLSRFNTSGSLEPAIVATDLVAIVRTALEISRLSGGAFDPTFSPLFKLWGFGESGTHRVPTDDEVAAVRGACGWQHLSAPAADQLRKDIPGLSFNLNAIAPGYASQRIGELLLSRGVTNFYVDVGGEAVVRGGKAPGLPWRLGIETPIRDALPGEKIHAVVQLTDGALATSGDYRNYFAAPDGGVYSHIFDPRVGRPATTRVASVSVIHSNGAWADALATTLFVMGPDEGLPWLTNVPGTEAYFLLRDGTNIAVQASPGFARHLRP